MTLADLIKPLVWFEVEKSRLGGKYKSDGYTIRYIEGFWLMDFSGEGKLSWRFPSLDAAKAAAQANYIARILSAIDSDAIAKIRADVLREAAEVGGRASVDLLLRRDPSANILKKQLVRRAVAVPILALIPSDSTKIVKVVGIDMGQKGGDTSVRVEGIWRDGIFHTERILALIPKEKDDEI